jgi:hypothetical protein
MTMKLNDNATHTSHDTVDPDQAAAIYKQEEAARRGYEKVLERAQNIRLTGGPKTDSDHQFLAAYHLYMQAQKSVGNNDRIAAHALLQASLERETLRDALILATARLTPHGAPEE